MSRAFARSGADESVDRMPPSKHRFYDAAQSAWIVKILPGEFHVARARDEILATVLGSCVSACIRDAETGIGGMNHFMLPESADGVWGGAQNSARFGNFAMEKLINELLKAGCRRSSLEIKIFGGASLYDSAGGVGAKNASFIMNYLRAEGFSCAASDLEGSFARRVQYDPRTGRVTRKLLGAADMLAVARGDSAYGRSLAARPLSGAVELFR